MDFIVKQLSPYRTSNLYMQAEVSSGKVACTYSIGKINRVEVQTVDFDSHLSCVSVFMNDGSVYSWETNNVYVVGYMMYGIPVSNDGRYVFAQQDMRGLYCLDAKTGDIVWKTKSKAEIAHVLVGEKRLCVSKSRNEIQVIDIDTGAVLNSYRTPFDNRFEVLRDDIILNHTRGKFWEIISWENFEVIETVPDKDMAKSKLRIEQQYETPLF